MLCCLADNPSICFAERLPIAIPEQTSNDHPNPVDLFDNATDYIEPGIFLIIQGFRSQDEAQMDVLKGAEEVMGVTGRQMSMLLGIDQGDYSKRRNGHLRFGSGRWVQIVKLLELHARGVPLNLARSIYWKEGIINWRNGNVSSSNHLLERKWEVPEEKGESDGGAADTLTQWGRQAGPQPKRKSDIHPEHRPVLPESPDPAA